MGLTVTRLQGEASESNLFMIGNHIEENKNCISAKIHVGLCVLKRKMLGVCVWGGGMFACYSIMNCWIKGQKYFVMKCWIKERLKCKWEGRIRSRSSAFLFWVLNVPLLWVLQQGLNVQFVGWHLTGSSSISVSLMMMWRNRSWKLFGCTTRIAACSVMLAQISPGTETGTFGKQWRAGITWYRVPWNLCAYFHLH